MHDSHCCIIPGHGCKYLNLDCPVVLGLRKQTHLCYYCELEAFGDEDPPIRTVQEQQELLDSLWEEKQNPKELSPDEERITILAEKYGRSNVLAILYDINITLDKMTLSDIIKVLLKLKHIP